MAAAHHVPVATRFAFQHARELLAKDQARARKMSAAPEINAFGPLRHHHHKRHDHGRHHRHHPGKGLNEDGDGISIGVDDGTVTYTADVMVGESNKTYKLIIDSGSYPRCAAKDN